MIIKPSDIITESQLMKWLGFTDYQMMQARPKLPKYNITRELRLYNKQRIVEYLENLQPVHTESNNNA